MAQEFHAGGVVIVDLSDEKEIVFRRKASLEERGSDESKSETLEISIVMDAPSEGAAV